METSIHAIAEEMIKSARAQSAMPVADKVPAVDLEKAGELAKALRIMANAPEDQVKQASSVSLRDRMSSLAKPMSTEDLQVAQLLQRVNGLAKTAADRLEKEAARKCKECKCNPCKCKGKPKQSKAKGKLVELMAKKKEGKR